MTVKQFSILEKVAAYRAILSVAKSVQEKRPDAPVDLVIDAIGAAVSAKLNRLIGKSFESLTAVQVTALGNLRVAQRVMPDLLDLLGDEETTRALSPDERDALVIKLADAAEKRKAAAAKRAAEKEKTGDAPKAPKKEKAAKPAPAQLSLADA